MFYQKKEVKSVEPLLKSMANMIGNETFEAVNKGLDLDKFVMAR